MMSRILDVRQEGLARRVQSLLVRLYRGGVAKRQGFEMFRMTGP